MSHIDPPESPLPTAGTLIASVIGAALLTFCTPAPAEVTTSQDLVTRCVNTTTAFIAAVDDDTSEAAAQALFDKLANEDKRWLIERAFPAYELTGKPPLEGVVPIIYEHCMKRGSV